MTLFRSLIFVPGNNPRFLNKAQKLSADIVCLDLEDSVPLDQKPNARKLIKSVLDSKYNSSIFVRTNSPSSGLIPKDLNYIMHKGLDGLVIPKINNTSELDDITSIITDLEKQRNLKQCQLIPSIESALGVVNAYSISSAKRVTGIVFGVFDLLNDIGVEYTKDSQISNYAKAKISLAAHAAGVPAIDAIWQDLQDISGLENDCKSGKSLGYAGKSIIHPDQIDTVHRIFHPTKSEILWAEKVRDTYTNAKSLGKGATRINGKMIDEVHYKQALSVLKISNEQHE